MYVPHDSYGEDLQQFNGTMQRLDICQIAIPEQIHGDVGAFFNLEDPFALMSQPKPVQHSYYPSSSGR